MRDDRRGFFLEEDKLQPSPLVAPSVLSSLARNSDDANVSSTVVGISMNLKGSVGSMQLCVSDGDVD